MAATNGNKTLRRGLSVEQQNAIDLLVTGKTDLETAEAVDVHRTSVTRWRLYDPAFQAAFNARRLEVWGASADKLRSLVPKALDALTTAMEGGNVLAAVTIIKAAALDKLPPSSGPTDPDQMFAALVEARVAQKRAKRERSRTLDDMLNEQTQPGYLSQWEAEQTAAARAEVEAELAAKLKGDGNGDGG